MKVVMVCSGGMSSAIVVKSILKEADKQNFDLEMIAVGSGEIEDILKTSEYDLLLVAPQVKHQFATFEGYANEAGVPIDKVEPMGYTPLGAPKTLLQIKKYIK
ncbi:PTS system, cellobiose-specific IIB component [Carnobacterium iners]|uniref:PTS system, cellobiose-specific IIB component n=1 Tax=Carnobacterium iners TaxID=1073423 RepID=A0A1X7MX70_9LACT|nr:PTS sugar transporter subunit IIB [Carnobacterium iners]SEL21422.1 PTS system, cellobiose-specific IIB component [Carnobacterium iners]SMH28667.1 PTS system, cellobiose-specific IIB component [Carnobacterium iners]